jgi:hypothetical protein
MSYRHRLRLHNVSLSVQNHLVFSFTECHLISLNLYEIRQTSTSNKARAEGIKNTGRWGREEERRATQILLSRWLINPANRPKLTEVLKEQGRRERHWHALHPITYVPDLPQNIPTRAVDPEENK